MSFSKVSQTIQLPRLPSVYSANENEVKLLLLLVAEEEFLFKPFTQLRVNQLIQGKFNNDDSYKDTIISLMSHGIIYSLNNNENSNLSYTDESKNQTILWYLHAEKVIQALANNSPDVLLHKNVLKFECNDEVFDGGFIEKYEDIFTVVMDKLNSYFEDKNDNTTYLPNFLRLYQYIGTINATGFYETDSDIVSTVNVTLSSNITVIPKYSVMKKTKQQSWINENNRICVCIN